MQVQPKEGMAVVFFPATIDGRLDRQALHAALPAVDVKYVSQIWIRQAPYFGQPSKRLPQTMGLPFGMEHIPQKQPQVSPVVPITTTNMTTTPTTTPTTTATTTVDEATNLGAAVSGQAPHLGYSPANY